MQAVVLDQQAVISLGKCGFIDQRPGPDGDGGDRRRIAEEQRIDRDGLGRQRFEREAVHALFQRAVEADQRIIPGPGEFDLAPADTRYLQAGPAALRQLAAQGETPFGAGFGSGEAVFDAVAGIAAEIPQDAAAERTSVTRLAAHPAVVDQCVVVSADRRFERGVIATVAHRRSGRVHGLRPGIVIVITRPHHVVKQDVLRQVGVIDARGPDQHAQAVEHVVGDIDIDPILPLQVEAVGDVPHLRIDAPRMVARFVEDIRHRIGTAVETGHHGEVHTPAARQLPDMGDARILLRIGSPCPEGVDIVGVVEQLFGDLRGGSDGEHAGQRQ